MYESTATTICFDKERVSEMAKISENMLTDKKLSTGYVEDDLLDGILTARLTASIYSRMSEEHDLSYICDRPTFFDWLLRRRKTSKFKLKVKEVLDNPKVKEGVTNLYFVE